MTPIAVVLLVSCALPLAATAQETVNRESPVLKDFEKRVADYVKLHRLAMSEIHGLKPTASPEKIEQHEHLLAGRIRELRRDAARGSVFTPEISAEFGRLIAGTMQGPEARRIRESLSHAAPVRLRALRVNESYPSTAPLQSTPPSLLLNLPRLPPEVEYRVVGNDLVLRDVEANLIVDFITNAIPSPR